MRKINQVLLLNGPNLNLLGRREPEIYGHATLSDIVRQVRAAAKHAGLTLTDFQSNSESALIERVQATLNDGTCFIIFNPGAFTHTSIALRDALIAADTPFVEVHLSNVFAREEFRQYSYLSDIAVGVVSGLGVSGYLAAVSFAVRHLSEETGES